MLFSNKKKHITVIGGGNGNSALLKALWNQHEYKPSIKRLDTWVSMSDDGKSTGRLMNLYKESGISLAPPGDLRRCLFALSGHSEKDMLWDFCEYRFWEDDGNMKDYTIGGLIQKTLGIGVDEAEKRFAFATLGHPDIYTHILGVDDTMDGHSMGNFLMVSLWELLDYDYTEMVKRMHVILQVSIGSVLPITSDEARIEAVLRNGEIIPSQADITVPKDYAHVPIEQVRFQRHCPSPSLGEWVEDSIMQADTIVLGPGDLHTSVIPNLLVPGVTDALAKTKASIVLVVNATNKGGEAPFFTVSDFVQYTERYLGSARLSHVVASNFAEIACHKRYAEMQKKTFNGELLVVQNEDRLYCKRQGIKLVEQNLFNPENYSIYKMPTLAQTLLRI